MLRPFLKKQCAGIKNPGGHHNNCRTALEGEELVSALEQSSFYGEVLCERCRDEHDGYALEWEKCRPSSSHPIKIGTGIAYANFECSYTKIDMENREKNLVNAGIIFMFSVWLQGQMSDLTILKKNPTLIDDFVASSNRVPDAFHQIRVQYWAKQFGEVKSEFVEAFSGELSEQDTQELEEIYHVRNMIAHAHISFGRGYMLYRPAGSRRERAVLEALKPEPQEDESKPIIFKLDFSDQALFNRLSDSIERLDQHCFARLSKIIGISHGRIR